MSIYLAAYGYIGFIFFGELLFVKAIAKNILEKW